MHDARYAGRATRVRKSREQIEGNMVVSNWESEEVCLAQRGRKAKVKVRWNKICEWGDHLWNITRSGQVKCGVVLNRLSAMSGRILEYVRPNH